MNPNFSYLLFKQAQINIPKLFHCCSNLGNHYDTLKLQSNCSTKQIRESFIKLSKEHHPDLSKNPNAHKKFLKIKDAYNVLSKPEQRALYDIDLKTTKMQYSGNSTANSNNNNNNNYYDYTYQPRNPRSEDPSMYYNYYYRPRQNTDLNNKDFYGFKRDQNQPNETATFVFLMIVFFAFSMQIFFIRLAFLQQNVHLRKSKENQEVLNELKEKSNYLTNAERVEIHRKQFEENAKLMAVYYSK